MMLALGSGLLGGALATYGMALTRLPAGIAPVAPFDLTRYLGTWHEVARLDHSFERGLRKVTAEYSPRPDGGIDVLNRGLDSRTNAWREARGRGHPLYSPEVGSLRVRFGFPLYAAYHVIALDRRNYSFAMVCGPTRRYLWILSRSPDLAEPFLLRLLDLADRLGFDVSELVDAGP